MDSTFPIDQILQRYNLPTNNSRLYSLEELNGIDCDQQFISILLKSFEDERTFSEKDYQKFSLEVIIDYIRRTHCYYLTKKLCEIEQSIYILLDNYSGSHPLLNILSTFFEEYTTNLTSHISMEEKELLPYIKSLLKFERGELNSARYFSATKKYSLQLFIDSHDDTERDLSMVRKTILNYHPPASNETPYRILICQLQTFEKDLSIHALIEDKVLVPRALQLQEKLNKLFLSKIELN